jgi:hypothetical protein
MASQTERMLETQIYSILDENKNVIPATRIEWDRFQKESPLKFVKHQIISPYRVSTSFIGIDPGFPAYPGYERELAPILFETMVFEGIGEDLQRIYQKRYSTWEEAEKGHETAVEWVNNKCKEHNNDMD